MAILITTLMVADRRLLLAENKDLRQQLAELRALVRKRYGPAVLVMIATSGAVQGQPMPDVPPAGGGIKVLSGFNDSYVAALADLQTIPPPYRRYIRYLWIPGGKDVIGNAKLCSFVLNWLSNAATISRPTVVGGVKLDEGKPAVERGPALVRVDLRLYAPRERDLQRWLDTWELLAFDPNYSRIITADTLRLIAEEEGWTDQKLPPKVKEFDKTKGKFLVPCKPWKASDGQTYNDCWQATLRYPAPYLNQVVVDNLYRETHSEAPVVYFGYFAMRALASIQDADLFRDVFGGLFYEFSGVRTAKQAGKKKATDLDVLFADLGIVDDADGPISAQAKIDGLLSEQRVARLRSEVTGKPRAVVVIPTLATVRGRGLVMLTIDFNDQDIDILKNPFANLLGVKPAAQEVIWTRANGAQGFALFNGAGALQREVPPQIALDHGVPAPYTKRLNTIGCITCHGAHNGWQPCPNEVLLIAKGGARVLTDVSDKNKSQDEVIELIASKYGGNLDGTLADLRRELIGATLRMTGPYQAGGDQTNVYKTVSARVDSLRTSFWYTPLGAKEALAELMIDPGAANPIVVLRDLLRPDPLSKVQDYILEDFRAQQMNAGRAIDRAQWELFKSYAATRAYQSIERSRKK